MKKSPLYTRTGDTGMTSLIGGQRVAKNSPRVSAYGTLDELNAMIGLVQAHCTELDNFVTATLLSINNTLFNIGAYLATPSPQTDSQPEAPAGDTPGQSPEPESQTDGPAEKSQPRSPLSSPSLNIRSTFSTRLSHRSVCSSSPADRSGQPTPMSHAPSAAVPSAKSSTSPTQERL